MLVLGQAILGLGGGIGFALPEAEEAEDGGGGDHPGGVDLRQEDEDAETQGGDGARERASSSVALGEDLAGEGEDGVTVVQMK